MQIAGIFRAWNMRELDSTLIDITADIQPRMHDLGSDCPIVAELLDRAGNMRTGKWSSQSALALGVPHAELLESVYARTISAMCQERVAAAMLLPCPVGNEPIAKMLPIEKLRCALTFSC